MRTADRPGASAGSRVASAAPSTNSVGMSGCAAANPRATARTTSASRPIARIPAGSGARRNARSGAEAGSAAASASGSARYAASDSRYSAARVGSVGCHTTPELRPDAPAAIAVRSYRVTVAPRPASSAASAVPTMPPPRIATSGAGTDVSRPGRR